MTLDLPTMPASPVPAISFDGIELARNGVTVLEVEALDLPFGYTTLVGPNGSGKSTMLHAIAGLLKPSRGSVVFGGGTDAADVAYVLQSQHTSEQLLVTAREVVTLARAATLGPFRRLRATDHAIVDAAMQRLDVLDLANRHLAEMSGGQRQRVFVAQGLAQQSTVLLLDEPVAGLDLASTQTIRRVIDEERATGRAVVVATHDLDEAGRADHVVMLNGRVVASGPPADVLQPEYLRDAYGGRVLELGDRIVALDDGSHHDH